MLIKGLHDAPNLHYGLFVTRRDHAHRIIIHNFMCSVWTHLQSKWIYQYIEAWCTIWNGLWLELLLYRCLCFKANISTSLKSMCYPSCHACVDFAYRELSSSKNSRHMQLSSKRHLISAVKSRIHAECFPLYDITMNSIVVGVWS